MTTRKRSFTITINLEATDGPLTDEYLVGEEDEVYEAVKRSCEDYASVAYVAHGNDAQTWVE